MKVAGRIDPIPNIRAAGRIIAMGDDGTHAALNHNGTGPGTPEHIKKYRKSFQNQPGIKQLHPGVVDDGVPVQDGHKFGRQTAPSEKVGDVIKAQNLKGLADKFNDIKESKYASQLKEPLATGFQRGYNWPEKMGQTNQFQFGVPTIGSENAKQVLYPVPGEEDEKTRQMYAKTHGNFAPGEQKTRDYNWQLDKTKHRFGYGEQRLLNGAAMSIHNERFDQGFPKTVIVKKTVEDKKAVTQDQLGKAKNLGQGVSNEKLDQVFGVRNLQSNDQWNAARCIHGEPTEKELQPDSDLGKSNKAGCRNVLRKPEDETRSFGAPTIRTDIPFKEKRSIADYNNYGDEPEAVDLLFPSTFTEMGITEYDFQLPRPKEEIKMLFERIGYTYKIGKFNAMYNRAKDYMGSSQNAGENVSVRAFIQAVNEMHNIE